MSEKKTKKGMMLEDGCGYPCGYDCNGWCFSEEGRLYMAEKRAKKAAQS